MYRCLLTIFAILCVAFGGGGCASNSKGDYEEILMPLQTGSAIQRRVQVKSDRKPKPTTKPTKEKSTKKPAPPKLESEPEPEPTATPPPQEESTPPPERFR